MMEFGETFRVPRSRAFDTHSGMRAEILASLDPVLFGSGQAGVASRKGLEDAFAEVTGHRHACGVHSGTIALFLALRAAGIGPGDEVITVANSDISTTAAILHCGAVPMLCDVRAEDFNIDVDQVEIHAGFRAGLEESLAGRIGAGVGDQRVNDVGRRNCGVV